MNQQSKPLPRKPRIPLMMKMIRWTYPKLERVAPSYAHHYFAKLFFTPFRYPVPEHEKQLARQAERIGLKIGDKKVQAYAWGSGNRNLLFVHGWAGRATQFGYFIEQAVASGFRALAIDAPAHGFSEGSATNIFEFKDSLLALKHKIGNVNSIVSHSLGGTASLFALTEGLDAKKLITIATPTIAEEIMHEYAARLQGSEHSKIYLRKFIHQKFNRPFDSLMASSFAHQLDKKIDMLVVHDENDKEASFTNAHHLIKAYPSARLLQTQGLGHVRILKDSRVIEACLKFLKN